MARKREANPGELPVRTLAELAATVGDRQVRRRSAAGADGDAAVGDVQADLAGGRGGPVGAAVQDRLSVERLGPDRAHPEHGVVAPDQEELEQEPARLLRGRVRRRRHGRVQAGAAQLYAVVRGVLSDLVPAAG
uniref:(northern house mosquito) hypothetical protein n=1 Tax=Culex pipiens TaxID=7175 RepID=A0A8D8FLJ1_CULPI